MFAQLGNIVFQVLNSFESFRAQMEYRYAEHKVVEARPRLQWIANELQKISIELGFNIAYMNLTPYPNPASALLALRTAAEAHQALTLVFGNGEHRGYFVIESIEETFVQNADDGSVVANQARMELREWVPGADFDPNVQIYGNPINPPPAIQYVTATARTPLPLNQNPAPALTPLPLNNDTGPSYFGQPAPQQL